MTRTGNPGRIVRVGWILSWRWTICWPVWLMLLDAPDRIACGAGRSHGDQPRQSAALFPDQQERAISQNA